jgi:hypothetical protein
MSDASTEKRVPAPVKLLATLAAAKRRMSHEEDKAEKRFGPPRRPYKKATHAHRE